MGSTMTKYETVDVDVEVEIDFEDVVEFIEDYATQKEKLELCRVLDLITEGLPNESLLDIMKNELLVLAAKRYSLEELEQRLGSKFDLTYCQTTK
jgi:hypothetical protein